MASLCMCSKKLARCFPALDLIRPQLGQSFAHDANGDNVNREDWRKVENATIKHAKEKRPSVLVLLLLVLLLLLAQRFELSGRKPRSCKCT